MPRSAIGQRSPSRRSEVRRPALTARTCRDRTPAHVSCEWSGRRGSNPRHSAWKADALPTELLPRVSQSTRRRRPGAVACVAADRAATTRAAKCDGNRGVQARQKTASKSTTSTYVSYGMCITRCIYAPPYSLTAHRIGRLFMATAKARKATSSPRKRAGTAAASTDMAVPGAAVAAAAKPAARKTARRKTARRKTTARKPAVRKTAARKTTARKTTARKTTARKTTARKPAVRKTAARKTVRRKPAVRRASTARKTVRKTVARKPAARKAAPRRKTTARKSAARPRATARRRTATKRVARGK
jgi:histone H1-like nucleoprotein HC2